MTHLNPDQDGNEVILFKILNYNSLNNIYL